MILDKSAFNTDIKTITYKTQDGKEHRFNILINVSVAIYNKILCLIDNFENTEAETEKAYYIAEIVFLLLQPTNQDVTIQWVINNIPPDLQANLLTAVLEKINEYLTEECYQIPDLKIKTKPNKNNKDREETQKEINECLNILKNRKAITLMDEIALVMMKTNNSYSDVMKMPILIFKDMIRTIYVMELRKNDDYNLAYLQMECAKYKDELNSGKVTKKPALSKGADLKGLKALLSK